MVTERATRPAAPHELSAPIPNELRLPRPAPLPTTFYLESDPRVVSALTAARISTTLRTASVEIPDCFAAATVSAAVNAIDRKRPAREQRRAMSKAMRLSGAR